MWRTLQNLFTQFSPQVLKTEISVERLHDNLIKLTFKIPGREEPGVEYWYRIPSPDIKIMAD